jgi:hypothetical protein
MLFKDYSENKDNKISTVTGLWDGKKTRFNSQQRLEIHFCYHYPDQLWVTPNPLLNGYQEFFLQRQGCWG